MAIDFRLVKIFVEGDGDKVFIRDILKKIYNVSFTNEQLKEVIIICKGYNQLSKQIDELKQIGIGEKREGGVNLVIFDADYTGREASHGYKNKKEYLEIEKKELGVEYELFLFPNNELDGTLETILESCIHPKHVGILDCWKSMETCVNEKGNYTAPADKSKIYNYLECLHGISNKEKDKIKDPNRDFTLEDKWVLDFNSNTFLNKLKDFFTENIK
jgi:predicted peroxiredoxin